MAFPGRNVPRLACRKLGDRAPAPEESRRAQRSGEGSAGPGWDMQAQPGEWMRGTERRWPIHAKFKNSGETNKLIFRELEKQILQSKNRQRSMARKYVALYPQGENFHIENHTPRS